MNEPASSSSIPPTRLGLAPAAPKPSRTLPGGDVPSPTLPQTPPPHPRSRKPPVTFGGWLVRAMLGVPLLGAAFLVFWCHQRLVPVQEHARALAAQTSRLSTEIGLMEGRLTPDELAKLAADYQRAQGLFFSSSDALKEWAKEVRLQMIPLALDAVPEFGQAVVTNSSNVTVAKVPATLSLNFQPSAQVAGARSPYERVLRFLDAMNQQTRRVDLVELQVSGGSNSIQRAVATLQLWAGEEVKPLARTP